MVVGAGMTLLEIRDAVVSFASAFDPSFVDGRAARAHVEQAAQIVKAAQAVLALAAARADECNGFDTGGRSPAHELAALTGSSVGEASATLTTGRRLEQQPDLADVARLGVLSPQQTMAISEALAADPSVDARTLVGTAQRSSLRELRDECERVKARGDHDREARRRRIHDERHLRRVTHHDGSAGVVMRGNPEDIARVYAAIAPRRDELFAAARREGRRERSESLDYDALLSTLRSPSCCDGGVAASDDGGAVGAGGRGRRRRGGRGGGNGQRAKILVRVDFDTLLRGYPIDGEVCEIAGYGPVSVGAVHDLLAEGGFLAAIVTKGERVTGVAHLGRRPRAVQDSALEWLDPICTREGCGHRWVERDHRDDWAKTKVTLVDAMDRLCSHDHDLKTRFGWALVPGRGRRPMVPPDDPRHPRYAARSAGRARAGQDTVGPPLRTCGRQLSRRVPRAARDGARQSRRAVRDRAALRRRPRRAG
jgi:hypothetical protein